MPLRITQHDLSAALPDVTSTLRLPGLQEPVDVYRDRWGIPHIRAGSENDLFFAQGFVTAQDRLWQMDMDRRQALGRWSEWVGTAGLEHDRLHRAAGMGRTARLDYENAGPQAGGMLDAYAAGVNAFLATTRSLPIEYTILNDRPEPWENWHCLSVYKMRNTLKGVFNAKLFRTRLAATIGPQRTAGLIRGYPQGHLLTVPPGAIYEGAGPDGIDSLTLTADAVGRLDGLGTGSNGWSIGGRLTASGLPLVAGDSHRQLDTPNVYYQVHLACPDFTVIGFSVPGMPGALHFCHNEQVAWGMTYGVIDTQDLFVERFREGPDGRQYEFKGEWRAATVVNETIAVRDADPVDIEITVTHHGPVIVGRPEAGQGIAVSDPGLIAATRWPDSARDAMRSKTVHELRAAFAHWTDRVNNYAVADVHGNFGYVHAGRVPIRNETNGWGAVAGWTGEFEWQGWIPHEELPAAINPPTDYVVTCNQRVVGDDYPYYVGIAFTPDFRARRVQSRILALERGTATVDDMAAIHADRTSRPAQVLTRALLEVTPADDASNEALRLLGRWDGTMDRDLVQPSIYTATRAHMTRRLSAHCLGEMADAAYSGAPGGDLHVLLIEIEMIRALERGDGRLYEAPYDWPGLLATALQSAVAELTARWGDDMTRWQWGRTHGTRHRHPLSDRFPRLSELLDPPAVPVHGDGDTPLAGTASLGDAFTATFASVNRYIHDPSDWSNSRWIVPLGASGHPGSPHYADQTELWSNVQTIPQLWEWERVRSEAATRQSLQPAHQM